VPTLRPPDFRKSGRAATGLMTLTLVLTSGAVCAQGTPDAGRPTGATRMAPPQPGPPAAPDLVTGDRSCGPDAGPGRGLKEADLDGDGKISRAEFMQMHEARFERLPKDRNGLVSVEDALRQGGTMPGGMPRRAVSPGNAAPDGTAAPGSGSRRPGTTQPRPPPSPMSPATPEPRSRPSGSNSPDGEPDTGPTAPASGAASSSASSPSSTPSSTAPQEAKPRN